MFTIDDREARQKPVVHREIRAAVGAHNVQVDRLNFGDYSFYGRELPQLGRQPHIGIECNTVPDLCSKINSGRLAYQLSNMIELYDVRILLITGSLYADRSGYVVIRGAREAKTKFARVWDILFAAQCHGVIVEFTMNGEDTASRIIQNWKYWNRGYEDHKYFREQHLINQEAIIPLGEALDRRVQFLMGIPGVGEDRARTMLQEHGSIQKLMIHASVNNGQSLKRSYGIGPQLAKTVHDFITLDVSEEYQEPEDPDAQEPEANEPAEQDSE